MKVGRLPRLLLAAVVLLGATAEPAQGAIVDADGGITIWVWYYHRNAAAPEGTNKLDYPDVSNFDGVAGCSATNDARKTHDAGIEESPHACGTPPSGPCLAEDKIRRDFEQVAKYLYRATEGKHWLKRVYITDKDKNGVGWPTADVHWDVGGGYSWTATPAGADSLGWSHADQFVSLRSAYRACAPDILLHELGHYLYGLADRYPKAPHPVEETYWGCFPPTGPGPSERFRVWIGQTLPNRYAEPTVMSGNYPHQFVDRETAHLQNVTHRAGGGFHARAEEDLKAEVLDGDDPSDDGPNRWSACTVPFAQDEWTLLKKGAAHVELESGHPELGAFPSPSIPANREVEIVVIDSDLPDPGTVLLLDMSNSMNTPAEDPAAKYIQEAALYFYHSSLSAPPGSPALPPAQEGEYVGALLFNDEVSPFIEYGKFNPAIPLPKPDPHATGSSNIALALETAIETLSEAHDATGANGGNIMLLSDGRSTTGGDLWQQVAEASQAGIRINTYAFGDADTTTLDDIAAYSSGRARSVGHAESPGHEVKLDLAREATTLRGSTAIYSCKGKIESVIAGGNKCEEGIVGGVDTIESTFTVPPGTRDLLFYVFLEKGNAADLTVALTDPTGVNRQVPDDQPTAINGRFKGTRNAAPSPGVWKYLIKGNLQTEDNIEIVAYARHPELRTRVWIEQAEGSGEPILKAQMVHRYPLMDVSVWPRVYSNGVRVDDRNSPQAKEFEVPDIEDGVYKLPLSLIPGAGGQDHLRVDVEFITRDGTRPGKDIEYEAGTIFQQISNDFVRSGGYDPALPFRAFATVLWSKPNKTLPEPSVETYRLPGSVPLLGALVKNANLLRDQTRVSLGAGVTARITSLQASGHGTILVIEYAVETAAAPGPRDLKLQYGSTILEKKNAIEVAAP